MVLIPVSDGGDIKCDFLSVCVCARACVCPDVYADGTGREEGGMKPPILFVVCTFLIQPSALHQ